MDFAVDAVVLCSVLFAVVAADVVVGLGSVLFDVGVVGLVFAALVGRAILGVGFFPWRCYW